MNDAEIRARQQSLVDAGYNIGATGPGGQGVDGNWGDKSKGAWNQYQMANVGNNALNLGKAGVNAIGSGINAAGGLMGMGLNTLKNFGGNIQSNVQNAVTNQNTISDGKVLGQSEAGYLPMTNNQQLMKSAGGILQGVGNTGLGVGKAIGSLAQGNFGNALSGVGQAGSGLLGGGMSALKGIKSVSGMLGKAMQGMHFGAKY